MSDVYFMHYGIKGMKWGVQNGPPYPLSAKNRSSSEKEAARRTTASRDKTASQIGAGGIIRKGHVFNRVGKDHLDINKSGALYVSSTKDDLARYTKSLGPNFVNKLLNGGGGTHVLRLKVVKNMNVPSEDQLSRSTVDFLKANPDISKAFQNTIFSSLYSVEDLKRSIVEDAESNGSRGIKKLAYSFSSMLANPSYSDWSSRYYKYLIKQGYDAIPDLYDLYGGISTSATIVINPSKIRVSEIKEIDKKAFKEAKAYVRGLEKLKISDVVS